MTLDSKYSIRQQNLRALLYLLDQHDNLSAKELSNLTNLSIVSINKLLDIIATKAPIIKTSHIDTKGRRAKTYQLNYDAINLGLVELIEINGQIKAKYYLTNLEGKIIDESLYDQAITSVAQLTNFINHEIVKTHPKELILGVPGATFNGHIQVSDIKALRGIDLSIAVKESTGIDTIVVNDANAATFGTASQLNESQNISVGIYFPNHFGPGMGIVVNNQLISGADGLAGEVQFSTIDSKQEITEQIVQYLQNIISFLNPHLVVAYIDKLALSSVQIKQIKQKLSQNLPLHRKYKLDFSRNFEKDYLFGLATIGRINILKKLATN